MSMVAEIPMACSCVGAVLVTTLEPGLVEWFVEIQDTRHKGEGPGPGGEDPGFGNPTFFRSPLFGVYFGVREI